MLKTLLALECRNFLGLNVLIHSRNQKNLRIHSAANLAVILLLGIIFSGILTGQVFLLQKLGLGNRVPGILIFCGAMLTLLVHLPGMGQHLFHQKGLEQLRAMPVRVEEILLSRLLGRYLGSLAMMAVLVPGCIVFGICNGLHLSYYLLMLTAIPAAPLIPLSICALVGTGVMALSSGSRHPVAIQTGCAVLLMIGLFLGMTAGAPMPEFSQDPQAMLEQISKLLPERLPYPPANWVDSAAMGGGFGGWFRFLMLSLAIFGGSSALLCRNFDGILDALACTGNRRSIEVNPVRVRSPLGALYQRERRRYFASSVYVSNTIIGPILAFAASAAMGFVNPQAVENLLPVSVPMLAPLVWSMICCMMPACSVAVSMEGEQIWQVKSLPISAKNWLDAKLLWTFSLMLPSYVGSEIVLVVVMKPELPELVWLLLAPLAMMGFSCCFALSADLRLHNFDFQKDEIAVKQSMSALVGGLGGSLLSLVCIGILLIPGGGRLSAFLMIAGVSLAAAALYLRMGKTDLSRL